MKLLRCEKCGDAVALSRKWRDCDCGESGGQYVSVPGVEGLDHAVVAGPCLLYGVSNRLFRGQRAECWPYDERTNGQKIRRFQHNTGRLPERVA